MAPLVGHSTFSFWPGFHSVASLCSVLQSLQELLQNWLLWLSTDAHVQPTTDSPLETTLGGSMSSVSQLIEYTGWLCVVAMRLESSSTLLLHFILDFYEKVCDIYINYDLPIVVLFPPVIFHSALLSLDATILNQLCYIMYRYRNNWTAAKKNRYLQKAKPEFSLSSKICKEYNYYLTAMVCCLWTSRPFKAGVYTDPETIENTGGTQYKSTLNIVYHPSLLSYAASFLLQESPEEMTEHLSSIQGKKWNWYLDYLYSEGFQGLKLFIKSSVHSSVPKPEENTE